MHAGYSMHRLNCHFVHGTNFGKIISAKIGPAKLILTDSFAKFGSLWGTKFGKEDQYWQSKSDWWNQLWQHKWSRGPILPKLVPRTSFRGDQF